MARLLVREHLSPVVRHPLCARKPRVNQNTVLRALRMLRDEGLLEFRRGQGVRVAGSPRRGIVLTQARELLSLARHHGYRQDELIEMIRTMP